MTVFAVSMVKDEVDIIATTVRHLATQVDALVVADNGSADGTREVLDDLAHDLPLTVLDDDEPAYYQSRKITRLAHFAATGPADWIVPFDADELWTLPSDLRHAPREVGCITADLFDHRCTALDGDEPSPVARMRWHHAEPIPLPKVAVRWHPQLVIHQGNHGADTVGRAHPGIEVRHFPYRSPDQLIRKVFNGAAAYARTDLPTSTGSHWRAYGDLLERAGPDALVEEVWPHFYFENPAAAGLVDDPASVLTPI